MSQLPCFALLLVTSLLAAQAPKQQGGFNADQWNRAVGLGAAPDSMFGMRRANAPRPNSAAIAAAFTWLMANQAKDGSWTSRHSQDATVAVTGVALLAMLGDGSTMRSGKWKGPIKKAVNWLRQRQTETGAFAEATGPHLLASLAMTEAYLLSNYKLIKKSAERGLRHADSRRAADGGWRPTADATDSDPALTMWGTTLIGTATLAAMREAARPNHGIAEWLGSPRAHLVSEGGVLGAKAPVARIGELAFDQGAANAFTLYWLKLDTQDAAGAALEAEVTERHQTALTRARSLPRKWAKDPKHKLSISEWFASSHAFAQAGDKKSLAVITRALATAQISEGEFRGTWEPIGVWGEVGGRAWTTAMAAMTLSAPFRYGKIRRNY